MEDIILLKTGYDIDKLKKEVEIICNTNNNINYRTDIYNVSGYNVYDLIFVKGANFAYKNRQDIVKRDTLTRKYEPTIYLKKCLYIQEILDKLNTEMYWVSLLILKAGKYIPPHMDDFFLPTEFDSKKVIRTHIPIITNPEVQFGIGDPKQKIYYLEAGNLYYIRTYDRTHWVKNNSNEDRYHLLIDMKPTEEICKKISI